MTVAMPFLQKLITFLWPPDISSGMFFCPDTQIKKPPRAGRLFILRSRIYLEISWPATCS